MKVEKVPRLAGMLVAAVFAAAVFLSMHASVPAEAHQDCRAGVHNGTERGIACNRYSGSGNHWANWVDACDHSADGYRMRAWASIASGEFPGGWDPNGANSGCANDQWTGSYLYAQRPCFEVIGCAYFLNHGTP